jgi:uncharacterized protein (TIGR02452 family)
MENRDMASRTTRARIARETVEILERGWYVTPDGGRVSLTDTLAHARTNSRLYTPDEFSDVFRRCAEFAARAGRPEKVEFRTANCTTLAAARRLVHEENAGDVLCLNFASAKNPGGGFLNGSQAQEESLARATGLYPCLLTQRAMYDVNRQCGSCLYTDHMIYSPRVPVFRDDDDALLAEPYAVSIVTAPAVNVGALHPREHDQIESAMLGRTEKVLALAAAHRHELLVLGAWGCGVFRNNPADVARWFHAHLCGAALRGTFRTVVFAVLDRSPDEGTLRPFAKQFGHPLAG